MKRLILILVAAAGVLLATGCAFDKTYYMVSGSGTTGSCFQATTNNADIRNALVNGGFQEGTCSAHGFSGSHYCTYDASAGAETYVVSVYWGTSYQDADIQAACTLAGWTYH